MLVYNNSLSPLIFHRSIPGQSSIVWEQAWEQREQDGVVGTTWARVYEMSIQWGGLRRKSRKALQWAFKDDTWHFIDHKLHSPCHHWLREFLLVNHNLWAYYSYHFSSLLRVSYPFLWFKEYSYSSPTLTGVARVDHQWTESTTNGCNQWLSLAKLALKMPPTNRNCSPVARTSRCGEHITFD